MMMGLEGGVNRWLGRVEKERVVMGGKEGELGGKNERGGERRHWQGEP